MKGVIKIIATRKALLFYYTCILLFLFQNNFALGQENFSLNRCNIQCNQERTNCIKNGPTERSILRPCNDAHNNCIDSCTTQSLEANRNNNNSSSGESFYFKNLYCECQKARLATQKQTPNASDSATANTTAKANSINLFCECQKAKPVN